MRITCLEHLPAFKLSLYVDYASSPATTIYLLFKLHCFNLHRTTRFQAVYVYEEPKQTQDVLVSRDAWLLGEFGNNLFICNVFTVRYFSCAENFVPMAKEISLDCNHKFIVTFLVQCCIFLSFLVIRIPGFSPSYYIIICRMLGSFIHSSQKELFSI